MNNYCAFPHKQSRLNAPLQMILGGKKMGVSAFSKLPQRWTQKLSVCDLPSSSVPTKPSLKRVSRLLRDYKKHNIRIKTWRDCERKRQSRTSLRQGILGSLQKSDQKGKAGSRLLRVTWKNKICSVL